MFLAAIESNDLPDRTGSGQLDHERPHVDSLHQQYDSRVETLREALESIESIEADGDVATQEVWALSDSDVIANRTRRLIEDATAEIVIVVGSDELLTSELLEALDEGSTSVNVVVGALTEAAQEQIREAVPQARVFISGLDWLHGTDATDETAIGRLLLVDRETILVSTVEADGDNELAVFGRGFGNGLVVIARRLMATGLIPAEDPGQS